MGIYRRWFLPRLTRWAMSKESVREQRGPALASARGEVLEIGAGPGLNLPFYPETVASLVAIDVNPGMFELAAEPAAPFPVRRKVLDGEDLPFDDESFDCVVSTWTLCSIPRVGRALEEVWRVLRPGGRLLFAEHGASPDASVRRWQDRLTPLHRRLTGGCHLNRDIPALIEAAGLQCGPLERFYLPRSPRILGYTYRGRASKPPEPGEAAGA